MMSACPPCRPAPSSTVSRRSATGSSAAANGMGCGRDGARDLGEVTVHRAGVGEVHDETRGHAALRAGCGQTVPKMPAPWSRVSRGARARTTPGPDPGERPLLANARFILEPDLRRFAARSLGHRGSYRPGEVFRRSLPQRLLGFGVGLRMARAHREPPGAERRQILADGPLMHLPPRTPRRSGRAGPAAASAAPRPPPDRGRPPASTAARPAAPGSSRRDRAAACRFDSPGSPSAFSGGPGPAAPADPCRSFPQPFSDPLPPAPTHLPASAAPPARSGSSLPPIEAAPPSYPSA